MIQTLSPSHSAILSRISFLTIGAQKAGTTWLFGVLHQHPDVFIPAGKELHFFSNKTNFDKGCGWYCDQFSGLADEVAVGECTPNYLGTAFGPGGHKPMMAPKIPANVRAVLPDVKLLVSLRNPVDRAVSAYLHFVTRGNISPRTRLRDAMDDYGIAAFGQYAQCLEIWYESFDPDRFKILVYEEDIRPDTAKLETVRAVYRFVGVDTGFVPEGLTDRQNPRQSDVKAYLNQVPVLRESPIGQSVIKRISDRLPKFLEPWFKVPIEQADIDALHEFYAPRQHRLEKLLGRSLPWG